MRSALFFPVAIAALVINASSSAAQSLGDVAKREELRRSAVRTPSKTYSDAALKADISAPPAPAGVEPSAAPSPSLASPPPAAPANASGGATVEPPAPVTKPKEDEAYWRRRADEHRARLDRAQKAVDRFTGIPQEDPREQARVAAQLKTAQDALTRADGALRLLFMQADVAGVPAAWVK